MYPTYVYIYMYIYIYIQNIQYIQTYTYMYRSHVYHPWHQFSTSDLPIGMISSVVIAMIWVNALAFVFQVCKVDGNARCR